MTLDFSKLQGLVPAVVQEHSSKRVLMLAFMNEEAFQHTVKTGFATFFSRSRQKLWSKGESSGHRLAVKGIFVDCDNDTILLRVEMFGPGVCHAGYHSCFFRRLVGGEWMESEIKTFDPASVYREAK
jgi:phosphoribosyl-AMP cyclohydrolase